VRVVTVPGSGESFDLDRPGAVAAWNRALNRRVVFNYEINN